MIVEDQREVSRLLRSALIQLEHKLDIVEVPSGEEAILDATRNSRLPPAGYFRPPINEEDPGLPPGCKSDPDNRLV
jgi:hypothetical protein